MINKEEIDVLIKEKQEENRFGVFSKIYKSIKERFK